MVTLTKERAKAALIDNGSVYVERQFATGDYAAKTFSFDLRILPPWSSDAEERKRRREYTVRITAADALKVASKIIEEIYGGMDLTLKEKMR